MNRPARRVALCSIVALALASLLRPQSARADGSYQTLPFSQNWTNTGLITANDSWSGVPGIQGFLGDDGTTTAAPYAGGNPQTLLTPFVTIDVNANQTNPTTFTTGGVTEFEIANPVVALSGSGTADAPHIIVYLNTTGQSSITFAYSLRDIDASTDNSIQPVALQYRIGGAGNFTNIPAGYVADASSGPSLATLVTPVSVTLPAACENQAQVEIRIMSINAASNDEAIGIDDISVTAGGGGGTPNLSVNDVSVTEGNSGTVNATFTVSLSAAAGAGGVTFDIGTADNTATTADNDYVASSLAGQSIAAGGTSSTFTVTVNGDATIEPSETFFVNVTNVTGATVTDGQGQGTIQNDDVTLVPIGAIQGSGTSSPLVGTSASTQGIVTAIKSNGFFIQEADGAGDGDPATSDGIFVFTNSAPAGTIAIRDVVQVTGNVSEFFGMTELVAPLTIIESLPPAAALPTPFVLTTAMPSATPAVWEQLEFVEGMRVRVPSMTVAVPTAGFAANHYTTGSSGNGIFYGVVTGVARPMREAGFEYPAPIPAGTTIPQWDANPELIKVDSDALTGAAKLDLASRSVLTEVVGPLDYTFERYTILPDPLLAGVTAPPGLASAFAPIAVADPTVNEFTVGSYNLQRFYDDQNSTAIDDTDENGTTALQFASRLAKASLHVRQFMKTPDIVGLIEVEDLPTLQRLATQIDADAATDPLYASYLVEGNDVGGIDVGFLVKTAGGRVTDVVVTQELDGSVLNNPNGSTSTLHDRPPLMLRAVVHGPNGGSYPVTVILNHLRSLGSVDSTAAGIFGWPTEGERVRAKRLAQAVDLANFVQARQIADPAERIIVMGDMNAFEVNDGYAHTMGTITGTAYDPNSTLVDTTYVPGDGVDLVTPDMVNLLSTVPAADERYGYVFDIAAQNLDHMLVSAGLAAATPAFREEHARVNADFHELDRSTTDRRLSDHDPVVGFFAFPSAEVSVGIADSPDPVLPGGGITYAITVTNGGPGAASGLTLTDVIPSGTVFASLTVPAGWSCSTPPVGGTGTITCTATSLAAGATAPFLLTVTANPGLANGTVVTNTASVTQTSADSDPTDNSATATTTVQATAALSVTKSASGAFAPGAPVTYTIVLHNTGAAATADNPGDELVDVLPPSLTLVSATATAGTAVATVATNTVTWNGSIPAGGTVTVTITATLNAGVAVGATVSNQATFSWDADGNGTNETSGVSDDPATGATGDPTSFVAAAAAGAAVIPALDGFGLGLLALLVALGGALVLGRRLS